MVCYFFEFNKTVGNDTCGFASFLSEKLSYLYITILKINQAELVERFWVGNGIIMVIPLISKPDESSGKMKSKINTLTFSQGKSQI